MSDRCPQCGCIQPDCGFVPNGVCTYAPASTPAPAPSRDTAGCSPEIDLSTPAKEPAAAEVREWWITDDEANREVPPDKIKRQYFHVIEKSAYDALKAENERLQQIAHVTGEETYRAKAKVWLAEIEKLKADIELFRQEREKYERVGEQRDAALAERDELARQIEIDEQRAFAHADDNKRTFDQLRSKLELQESKILMFETLEAERDTLRRELSEAKRDLDLSKAFGKGEFEARAKLCELHAKLQRSYDCAAIERDEARAECDQLHATWEQDLQAREKNMANYIKELKSEIERLRQACKRNPSSGSCIAALGNGGT